MAGRFAEVSAQHYCGVDLHSKTMTVVVMNASGKILKRARICNGLKTFLDVVKPYRQGLAVAVETTFNWQWFVDGCRDAEVSIYLGHAAQMRLICGSKHKNDAIDAERIAHLLRSNMLPLAYAYPAERRFVRDMLRMRSWLAQRRAHQVGRLNILLQQHGHTDLCSKLDTKKGRTELSALIAEPSLRTMIEAGCICIKTFDEQIGQLQTAVQEHTNATLSDTQNLLLSIPGVGPVLSQTILYEIDSIRRFKKRQNFSSYCRLVNPLHTSDGKTVGHGNRKCGNAYLKWALMQCVTGLLKAEPDVRSIADKLKTRYAPLKARAILANRLATAIFYMLKHDTPFDIRRFCRNTVEEADSPEQRPVAAQAA